MLRENELRIGNYYIYKEDSEIQKIDDAYSLYLSAENIKDIEPIELTEEILLKCGFEKGLKYFSYKDFDVDLKGWFGFNNMVANANIKHLHQLQNLYWCLNGEELEIKL